MGQTSVEKIPVETGPVAKPFGLKLPFCLFSEDSKRLPKRKGFFVFFYKRRLVPLPSRRPPFQTTPDAFFSGFLNKEGAGKFRWGCRPQKQKSKRTSTKNGRSFAFQGKNKKKNFWVSRSRLFKRLRTPSFFGKNLICLRAIRHTAPEQLPQFCQHRRSSIPHDIFQA